MTALQQASERWLAWMAAASWQLALLVCIVAVIAAAARGSSPRLRHALWLLVLIKVFLPPTLTTSWSIGRWGVAPMLAWAGFPDALAPFGSSWIAQAGSAPAAEQGLPAVISGNVVEVPFVLMIAWAAGCLVFWAVVVWRYRRLARLIRSAPLIDEGPVRIALEQIALELELARVPDLHSTHLLTSPFLFGVLRPGIVIPQRSLAELSEAELRAVLTHELVHFKNCDTWIGWLQVLAQSAFWFHPFVWWANSQLRHERECVCDEAVLRLSQMSPQHYGESIVRVLTASRGRSLIAGSLVGVFERGAKLQIRLEDIMSYEPQRRKFGWMSRLLLAALALLLLPMAPAALHSAAADAPYPQVVKTSPQIGATDVDPGLTEITVTFDRDMNKQGMSWTGIPPQFPPIDNSRKPQWKDSRTCALPVKLEKGTFYRAGINDTKHQNFKGSTGVAAPPSVIYFTTKGATAEVEAQVRVPQIVSLEPKNGAMNIDPSTSELRVTFNMPMSEGMSWTGSGPAFPTIPEGKRASWSNDGLNCTLPVTLEPAHDYTIGLNSLSHNNFQSKAGVPLAPVVYKFHTGDKK